MGLLHRHKITNTNLYNVSSQAPFLVVGLGNIGPEYTKTRHNIGFMAVDEMQQKWEASDFSAKKKLKCELSEVSLADAKVYLAKPSTLMNNSGEALRALVDFYQIPANHILIIADELDLPFGTIRCRVGGGDAGHNGIKSIDAHLKEVTLARIRVGIANEHRDKNEAKDFVLNNFAAEETKHLPVLLSEVARLADSFIHGQFAEETIKTLL